MERGREHGKSGGRRGVRGTVKGAENEKKSLVIAEQYLRTFYAGTYEGARRSD